MLFLQGYGLSGEVVGFEISFDRLGDNRYLLYAKRCRMEQKMIVSALVDRPLRAVKCALSLTGIRTRLTAQNTCFSTTNKNGVQSGLMNTYYTFGKDIEATWLRSRSISPKEVFWVFLLQNKPRSQCC